MKGHGVEMMGTLPKNTYYAMTKLLLVCTAPQGALDKGAVTALICPATQHGRFYIGSAGGLK